MMKYLQLSDAGYILFEDSQNHADIAKRFPCDTVISAGFVSEYDMKPDQIACYGESTTLKISSKADDSNFIHRRLNTSY